MKKVILKILTATDRTWKNVGDTQSLIYTSNIPAVGEIIDASGWGYTAEVVDVVDVPKAKPVSKERMDADKLYWINKYN